MSTGAENATHTDVMPCITATSVQSPARPDRDQLSALAEQFEELLDGFRNSENQRFRWVELCKADFRDWITRRGVLDRQAEAMLQSLKDVGWHEQAAQLSAALAAQRLVSHPGSFDIVYTTDYGVEKMVVFFEGRETSRGGSVSNFVTNTPCSDTDASYSEMGSAEEEEEGKPVDFPTAAEKRPIVLPQEPTPRVPLPKPAKQLPACKRCQQKHNACDRAKPSCTGCLESQAECQYAQRTEIQATQERRRRELMGMPLKDLMKIARTHGVDVDAAPKKGTNAWLAWKVVK